MKIKLNGTEKEIPEGTTVLALLESLGVNPKLCVVEINRDIVRKGDYETRKFEEGDEVEIVTLVGGG